MRRPTSPEAALDWHRRAIAGENPPRHEGDPQCGWYRIRHVKGGPYVPMRIWLRQIIDPDSGDLAEPEKIMADVGGEPGDPVNLWVYAEPITRETYEALVSAITRDRLMQATHVRVDLARNPIGPSRRA